jgi:hypothetical protein
MKRYYVAPVIGDGQTPETAFRPNIPAGLNAVYALDPSKGWAVCVIAASDHSGLVANSKLVPLPLFPLDAKLSALGSGVKATMTSGLQAKFGISLSTQNTDAYRDFIRQLGQLVDKNFDENNFDVADTG